MIIPASTIGFCLIGVIGTSAAAAYVAINWDSIYNNKEVQSAFRVFSDLIHLGDIMSSLEQEPEALPKDLPNYKTIASGNSSDHKDITKFGGKYRNLLVGETNNDEWWKWSIKRAKGIKEFSAAFQGIKDIEEGQHDTEFTKLKDACIATYKKEDATLDSKERANAWFLCSPFSSEPPSETAIPKHRSQESFAHHQKDHTPHLIATTRPSNKNVWDQLYKKLIENQTPAPTDSQFSQVKSGYSKDKGENTSIALNQACENLYSKKESEISESKDNLWKYCSFSGTEPKPTSNTKDS